MGNDSGKPSISRREVLITPPAALAASAGLVAAIPDPASAAPRTVQRICRSAWGAAAPIAAFTPHTITELTVHHSAVALRDNRLAPQHLRVYQADHQARGWPDIAYHVLIDRHGNVYRGRPLTAVGDTATSYDPTGHLLVLCVGNFEEQSVSSAQLDATIDVLAWASTRFGVSPTSISGHRDHAQTLCPGEDLYRYLDDGTIQHRVDRRVGHVRLVDLCGQAGRRRVRRIENGTD